MTAGAHTLPSGLPQRVALFGGSFNPPHVGHVLIVAWLLSTGKAEEVWMIPTARHPFGKALAPFDDRMRMTEAACALFGAKAKVLSIEAEREGPSYSIDTVEALRARHPDVRFSWVVGTDVEREGPGWRSFDRLRTLVELVVVRRAGVDGSEREVDARSPTPLFPAIASSEVRARIAAGESIEGLVPAGVRAYIESRGLYR